MWLVKTFHPILQNPVRLGIVVSMIRFCIGPIIIGVSIYRIAWFQYGGLDVLVLGVTKGAIIKVDIMSIEEKYFIVDSGGAADSG